MLGLKEIIDQLAMASSVVWNSRCVYAYYLTLCDTIHYYMCLCDIILHYVTPYNTTFIYALLFDTM